MLILKDITKLTPEQKAKIARDLDNAEDKSVAIIEAMAEISFLTHQELIADIRAQAERAKYDSEYRKAIGLRTLSEKETAFYNALKAGPAAYRQAVTASQIDIFPTEIYDHTLDYIRKESRVLKLIRFAPPGVKKWVTASKTGAAAWGALTDAFTAELTATLSSIDYTVNKLYAIFVIPKAIRDLEIGYVDKYVTAILAEAMIDGEVKGYLYGNGKNAPIGISKKVGEVNNDGTAAAKTKVTTVTGFSPLQLAPHLTTLSDNGLRSVGKICLLCNPVDKYRYVNPALYGDTLSSGYVSKAFMEVEVIDDPQVMQGDGFLTIEDAYDMGFSSIALDEYKETKAVEDADLLVAKAYGNGRPVDDNTAVYFDITKLDPYIPTVQINTSGGSGGPDSSGSSDETASSDATLSALTIGTLTLSPTFAAATTTYTANTTNATNTVTATATENGAAIAITLGENTTITNGSSVTWEAGENTLKVVVTAPDGTTTKTYTVTVTKS